MTQMGEMSAVALVKDINVDCPFEHKDPADDEVENDLVGIGKNLGDNMEGGAKTVMGQSGPRKVKRPMKDPKNDDLYNEANPIRLPRHNPEHFPLTCAAHHLIPAQASLRDSEMVVWLVNGAVSAQVKDGKGSGTGRLSKNVGYNVNGLENGVWLPGPYALRTDAVKVAMGSASSSPTRVLQTKSIPADTISSSQVVPPEPPEDDLEEEDDPGEAPTADAPSEAFEMPGNRHGTAKHPPIRAAPDICEKDFPKYYAYYFLYTISAMEKAKGQYHDAHGLYSKRVKKALNEFNTSLNSYAYEGSCEKCKEINEAAERDETSTDYPPPVGVVDWLDNLSSRLRQHVQVPNSGWKWPIFTSKYAMYYWKYDKDWALRQTLR